jgi:Cu/Ag efflux protein CusF
MQKYGWFFMMVMIAASLSACTDTPAKSDLKIERGGVASVTATVEAVDLKTRMVTLRGPEGKGFTVHAGEEVVNLPQVRVGDEVVLAYVNAVSVRIAESGEYWDESVKEIARAKPGTKPGIIEVNETKVTAMIEDIDKDLKTASLRMPDGSLQIVKVKDPANLEKVKAGDRIVITFSEAVAISVQKP